jgi:glycosyltransferase involved in cell wall biosynthesis
LGKKILEDNGIKQKINIVPLGIDNTIFDYKLSDKNTKQSNDPYVFIMIGKWEVRKGYDLLLDLFNKAFSTEDNVELWLMGSSDPTCFSQQEMDQWHSFYSSGPLASKIRIIPRVKAQKDVADLISKADCGLFVSRAEGWNLELLEVMAMNKPVITTNYSAHTEFCDKNNSFLIDITEKETAFDGKWFLGHGNWAKIGQQQIDQTIDYMRYVYKNNIRTNIHGIKTGQKYSWQHSAQQLIQCIS